MLYVTDSELNPILESFEDILTPEQLEDIPTYCQLGCDICPLQDKCRSDKEKGIVTPFGF